MIKLIPSMVAAVVFSLFSITLTLAQSKHLEEGKFEVGGHFTVLNATTRRGAEDALKGFGGRLTYNINDFLAVEGELNYFPQDLFNDPLVFPNAHLVKPDLQGLFGLKAGMRWDKIGVFGKIRPGFNRFSPLGDCPNSDLASCGNRRRTEFTMDVGLVVEGYVSRRAFIRIDAGVTNVRYGDTIFFVPIPPPFPRPGNFFPRPGFSELNLQVGIGAGFRF